MSKKSLQKPKIKNQPIGFIDSLLFPFLIVLFILVKIGDLVKILFKTTVRSGFLLVKFIVRVLMYVEKKAATGTSHFLQRISSSLIANYKLLMTGFSTVLLRSIRVKPLKITLPKLKISLPKLRLPKISFLKISLPKFLSLHLPKLGFRRTPKPHSLTTRSQLPTTLWGKLKWFFLGIFFTLVFIFIPYQTWIWLNSLPNPQLLTTREIPVTTKIFDRNKTLLYEIYADQNRTPVSLADIPENLKKATIAIEDRNFYNHLGFSPKGILRAAYETILNHRLQGGSTITQQLVRSALLTPEPTLARKIKELILSFWAERLFTKNQILEMYLNQVPYGGTAWGVEAASRTYFGKGVKNLDLSESAYLAGLPASPSVFSPYGTHPEEGLSRQKEVLKAMTDQGLVSKIQENQALVEKLNFQPAQTEIKAPHFVMYIKDLLEKKYGSRLTQMGGLQVTTTLDLKIQEMAQEIVSQEIENLTPLHVGNGAVLITSPQTGEILSMVGSKDYFDNQNDGNVNLTLALRQPGSSIKVVNYALALAKSFTAASIIDDSPITFQVAGQPPYSPVNYDRQFHGRVTLREALGNSFNIPAVKVLAKVGVGNMIDQGRKMGITSWIDESRYGLSLTLGGGEVTMLDMARVYGTLADLGKMQNLTSILKVTDYKGQVLEEFQPKQGFSTISPGVAFILSNILADNQARSRAFGFNSLLVVPNKTVSVKTGTSNDLKDNWAIGYTPSFVVTTWVGNNDNGPMSYVVSGITGATPIWQKIMIDLLKNKADEPILPPDDVVLANVCGRNEYFLKGTEQSVACPPPPTPSPSPNP